MKPITVPFLAGLFYPRLELDIAYLEKQISTLNSIIKEGERNRVLLAQSLRIKGKELKELKARSSVERVAALEIAVKESSLERLEQKATIAQLRADLAKEKILRYAEEGAKQ